MSLRDSIYNILASDSELIELLAAKPEDLGTGPAIYGRWAANGTPMPYLTLTYSFRPGGGEDNKRAGALNIEIFDDNNDTRGIERINNRVKGLLSDLRIMDPDDGPIFLDLDTEAEIPEPVDSVIHWNLVFLVRHWDKSVISTINNR